MNNLLIGQMLIIGHNSAKTLGDSAIAYETLRVEAKGADWIVLRDRSGSAHCAAFTTPGEAEDFIQELDEVSGI